MKRKKFLALALAGVMTAVTLTACAPLEDLYDWFFGGGSVSASRGNGVNLVEVSPEQKHQIVVNWFGLGDGDVTTPDRSRKALNEVAKNQLPQNSGMCIDVMKWSPTSADAAPAIPNGRTLYWAQYTDRGNGGTFGVGEKPSATDQPTYTSGLWYYSTVKSNIGNRVPGSNVDFFAGTFTKDGETYLAVAAIWALRA